MDPISLVTSKKGIETISNYSPIAIEAIKYLYEYLTEEKRNPLCNKENNTRYQDLDMYNLLCTKRKILSPIPNEWSLDDKKRPQYNCTFKEKIKEIKVEINELDNTTYPLKGTVISILNQIEELYINITVRQSTSVHYIDSSIHPFHHYRSDGYEAMFYNDLIVWLCEKLPRENIKDTATAILIDNWIKYCEYVHRTVFQYRNDVKLIHSPKNILGLIIIELKGLLSNIEKLQKATSFDEKLTVVSTEIIHLARYSLNFQYLLIENKNKNPMLYHSGLNIIQILRHSNSSENTPTSDDPPPTDSMLNNLLNTVLGNWLTRALLILGIKNSDFSNNNKLDLKLIRKYFKDNISDVSLKKTGLWKFARKDKRVAEDYLLDIAEIYRLILDLYYVRNNIVLTAKICRHYGDAWVYGEDTSTAPIEDLLKIVSHATETLTTAIKKFWEKFYSYDYLKNNHSKDRNNIDYNQLGCAQGLVENILKQEKIIDSKLEEIRSSLSRDPNESSSIKSDSQELTQNIREYYSTKKLKNITQAPSLSNEPIIIDSFKYQTHGDELIPRPQKVIYLTNSTFPIYLEARKIYENYNSNKSNTLHIPAGLKQFQSKKQEIIYNYFLIPYYWRAVWSDTLSFIFYQNPKIEFKKTYFVVSSIFNLFYINTPTQNIKTKTIETALVDMFLFEILTRDLKELVLSHLSIFNDSSFDCTYDDEKKQIILSPTDNLQSFIQDLQKLLFTQESQEYEEFYKYRETQEKLIENLKLTIAGFQEERQLLQAQIAEKDGVIAKKDGIIAEKDGIIAEQENENIQLKEIVSEKERENALLTEIVSEKERENALLAETISKNKIFLDVAQGKSNGKSESKKSKSSSHFGLFSSSTSSKSKTSDTKNENEMVNLKCSGL